MDNHPRWLSSSMQRMMVIRMCQIAAIASQTYSYVLHIQDSQVLLRTSVAFMLDSCLRRNDDS